jgi:hypothetical protein
MSDSEPPLVWSVAPGRWILEGVDDQSVLAPLGASVSEADGRLVLDFEATDTAAAMVAANLRDAGFAFDDCRDWSPKALLIYLRTKGLLDGPFLASRRTASGRRRIVSV